MASDRNHMDVSPSGSPVRDIYARMHRLGEAIDDPDSSAGQRRRWGAEYTELVGDLVGTVGARTAYGAMLVEQVAREPRPRDGHADLYL